MIINIKKGIPPTDQSVAPDCQKHIELCIGRITFLIADRQPFTSLKNNIVSAIEPYSILTNHKPDERISVHHLPGISLSNKAHGAICFFGACQPPDFIA
jgi:hypothetical protein